MALLYKDLSPLPKIAKLLAILQLCIVFSLFLWIVGQPFLGQVYQHRVTLLNYQVLFGEGELVKRLAEKDPKYAEILSRNHNRFNALPSTEQQTLKDAYQKAQLQMDKPFYTKLIHAFEIFWFEVPSFEKAWIFFGLMIPLMVLIGYEGAKSAAWILPIIAICYSIDNQKNGWIPNKKNTLFPTEEYLIKNYMNEPLDKSISIQHQQLDKAWKIYLVTEWAHQTPSDEITKKNQQIEIAEFNFQLARVHQLMNETQITAGKEFTQKKSPIVLSLYVLWNLLLAVGMNKKAKEIKTIVSV